MEVQFEKTGACEGKLSVTIPAEQVDAAFARVYKNLQKNAKVPGFRPGKAPRQVLEAHYGDQVREDVENDLVRSSLPGAITQENLTVVTTPRVDAGELKKGIPFSYTAQVETQPEIQLQGYQGLTIVRADAEVKEDAVQHELEHLREQSAQLAPVLDRDTVQEGDLVLADYEATQGGIPLPGSKAENTLIEVSSAHEMIPGLSKGLLGAAVPGQRSVPVDFPEDFAVEAWRNKQVTFQVQLKELKKRELPELDDEFAKDLGEESLQELRNKIEKSLKERAEQLAKQEQRKNALEALIAKNPFDVPPSMIAEQTDRMIVDAAMRVQQMMGPRFNLNDLDIEALRADNRERAEFNVRSGLLLLKVAEEAKLEVTDAEIDAEIEEMAKGAEESADRVRAHYNKPDQRERIKYKLLEDKTIQTILEGATLVDPTPKSEEG